MGKCLGVVAAVPRTVHDTCTVCEVLYKFAVDWKMSIIHVGSVGNETGKCAGENKLFSALLHFYAEAGQNKTCTEYMRARVGNWSLKFVEQQSPTQVTV